MHRGKIVCAIVVLSLAACAGSGTGKGSSGAGITPLCITGAVSERCTCGGTAVTDGYCCAGAAQAAACSGPYCGDGSCGAGETGVNCPRDCPLAAGALIADHHAVAAFDRIPASALDAARALTLHFAHTSHGSQIETGLAWLQGRDARYAYAVRTDSSEGLPAATSPASLRIYDGNPGETYITPELYWDGDAGRAATRSVAATGHYGFSMWAWCGQQSSNDAPTVQRYLDTVKGFEGEFPAMRFILMTGHTDPYSGGTLEANNEAVRKYAADQGMALYDFADIESYDPAGNYYPDTSDACAWCGTWCDQHPGSADCTNLPGDCAHSHGLNCVLKAKAFWWMMARLAGWDGN